MPVDSSAPVVQVGVIVAAVGGLWVGARLLVDAAVRLARRVGLSELTIGLTIVAAGTSTPELAVTADAALKGLSEIAVGNVVGSSIYNLAFILGLVSLVRVVPIERSLVHRDGIALAASTLLAGGLLLDGSVSRLDGVVLLGTFVGYTAYLLLTGATATGESGDDTPATDESESGTPATGETSAVEGDRPAFTTLGGEGGPSPTRDVLFLLVGLGLVLLSGDLLVGAASTLARSFGVSEWVIGGTIVAAGTSTPELAVSLVAVGRGRLGVSVGNVVGSNVFNLLGILGLGALLRPLAVGPAALESVAWLAVVTVAMVAALWTGRRLSRLEGGLFTVSEAVRWMMGLLEGVG